ncbi:MAG: L-seryl-tRNA(Sec) selenium transferase, partial [Paraburkholderia hospita]
MSEVSGNQLNRDMRALLARVPAVERVLSSAQAQPLIDEYGRTQVVDAIRAAADSLRRDLLAGTSFDESISFEAKLIDDASHTLAARARPHLRAVFNLTGTVLHTNLGRALLPDEAVRAVVEALTRPMNLEFDLATGSRGDRDDLIDELICELTGAEAATVVNNNAAAVLLTLSALASKKEVVVSRGELVEIGGAFRIPDIMSRAGAKLREIGTTNRTHLKDYDEAINARTALLMKVHCSNYAI